LSDPILIPRADAPRVSFVIPSAADPELLFECLRSLERNVPQSVPTETIVVLDGAPEGSASRVQAFAPGVLVAASSVRLGLARAGNRGRRLARGEFLALLHDDATIDAGWLEALLAAADAHPSAGAFGGLVLFPDGTPQTAGVVLFRDGAAVPPWPSAPPAADGFVEARPADFCGSNALLVRAAAWDAAGGLDERFFPAYFSDADLAMSLRAAGWWVLFEPRARNRHRRGASSRRDFQEWVSGRNRGVFVAKWANELEDFEPWEERSRGSIERALERARLVAERLSSEGRVRRESRSMKAGEGDAEEERRALEQDLALQREWARTLAVRLDAARDVGDDARAALEAHRASAEQAAAASREAAARLRAFEGLFWWRLYGKALPVLRPLRGFFAAFSRPGSSSRTG
jgi:GT2 family glycosyltransferase